MTKILPGILTAAMLLCVGATTVLAAETPHFFYIIRTVMICGLLKKSPALKRRRTNWVWDSPAKM